MENQPQVPGVNNGNNTPPPNTVPPAAPQPVYPAPVDSTPLQVPQPFISSNTAAEFTPSTEGNGTFGQSSGKSGLVSLGLGVLAIVLVVILILADGLVSSSTMAYVWMFIFLLLSAAGLFFGAKSQKNKQNGGLAGLIGIVVATVVCVSCIIAGTAYIKLQIQLNSLNDDFNTRTNSVDFQD